MEERTDTEYRLINYGSCVQELVPRLRFVEVKKMGRQPAR